MKKADKPRYWLTFLLKNLEVGETFSPDALHLTIIPWFVCEPGDAEVIESFRQTFSGWPAFEITVDRQSEFKNSRRIPVNFIAPSAAIDDLQKKALKWFDELGARWAVQNPHVGEDYVPHIRRRKGHNVSEFDKLNFNSLCLVAAHRRGDDTRTIIAKADFDEE